MAIGCRRLGRRAERPLAVAVGEEQGTTVVQGSHLSNGKKKQGGGNGGEYLLRRLSRMDGDWLADRLPGLKGLI